MVKEPRILNLPEWTHPKTSLHTAAAAALRYSERRDSLLVMSEAFLGKALLDSSETELTFIVLSRLQPQLDCTIR